MLEEGIDYPKSNLVIRFDPPSSFSSYIHSKSKASTNNANFFMMYELPSKKTFIHNLAKYYEIERVRKKNSNDNNENQVWRR